MPKTYIIKKKKVENIDGRAEVLKIYFESIKDLPEEDQKSLKIANELIARSDWISQGKQFLNLGGKDYVFDELKLSIGEHSYELLLDYISQFLNKLIEQAESSPENKTDENIIGSRYVLIYEILLRFLVVMLSDEENRKPNDMSEKTKASNLLSSMDEFGKLITSSNTLELNFNFKQFLYEHHVQWIVCISDAIKIIQIINQPTRSFTEACNYFGDAQRCAKAHIASLLVDNLTVGALGVNWIEKTYCQSLLSLNASDSALFQIENTIGKQIGLYDFQEKIVIQLKNKNLDKGVKLQKLFIYLNETIVSEKLFSAMDGLISISNWMLLLKSSFNIGILSDHISKHGKYSQEIFSISDTKKLTTKSNIVVLMNIDFASGDRLALRANNIAKSMASLALNKPHSIVKRYAVEKIAALIEYQEILGIEAVNSDQLKLSSEPSSQLQQDPTKPQKAVSHPEGEGKETVGQDTNQKATFISEAVLPEITLGRFNELVKQYESGTAFYSSPDAETIELIDKVRGAINDFKRGDLVYAYINKRTEGRFYGILTRANNAGQLFNTDNSRTTALLSDQTKPQKYCSSSKKLLSNCDEVNELLDIIGENDQDSKKLTANIIITRAEIKSSIDDCDDFYTGDMINLLCYRFSKNSLIAMYQAVPVELLNAEFHEYIKKLQRNIIFVPVNVAYENTASKYKNHWAALIIDKANQLISYFDPAQKPIPKEISVLKDFLSYSEATICNPIDFQIAEKQQGFVRHCGPYVIEIFNVFEQYIQNKKPISGSYLENKKIQNSVSAQVALSQIPCGEAEKIVQIRRKHIRQAFQIANSVFLSKQIDGVVIEDFSEEEINDLPIEPVVFKQPEQSIIELSQLTYIAVELSSEVYRDDINYKKTIDGEWEFIQSSYVQDAMSPKEIEYVGICYANQQNKIAIIAHRGTQNTRARNLHENYTIISGKLPSSYEKAKKFSASVREIYPGYRLIETGHSVGGLYAALNACTFKTEAITFDSPGIGHYESLINTNAAKDIINYLSAPHFINTVSWHVGKKYRLYPSHVGELMANESAASFFTYMLNILGNKIKDLLGTLACFELSYINRQHSIENIRKTFDEKLKIPSLCSELNTWPTLTDYIASKSWEYLNPVGKLTVLWPKFVLAIWDTVAAGLVGETQESIANRNRRIEHNLKYITNYTVPKIFCMLPVRENITTNPEQGNLFVVNAKNRYMFFYTDNHQSVTSFSESLKRQQLLISDQSNEQQSEAVIEMDSTKVKMTN